MYDPEARSYINGAQDLLEYVHKRNVEMVLIAKGDTDMYAEVDRLDARGYFKDVIFREGDKQITLFEPFVDVLHPEQTIFIGDRVHSELAVGNELNTITVWVRQGKFATEAPETEAQEPTYTVKSLAEVVALLKTIL